MEKALVAFRSARGSSATVSPIHAQEWLAQQGETRASSIHGVCSGEVDIGDGACGPVECFSIRHSSVFMGYGPYGHDILVGSPMHDQQASQINRQLSRIVRVAIKVACLVLDI